MLVLHVIVQHAFGPEIRRTVLALERTQLLVHCVQMLKKRKVIMGMGCIAEQ